MRVRSSDDENGDIMELSDAIILADDDLYQPLENEMAVTKKEAKTVKPATDAGTPAKKTKAPVADGKKGVFGPREVPEGHVGIAILAEETGLTASVIRRKLRTMENVAKPEGQHGWYWKEGSKELNAIRKALAPAA